jgi:hypothetical protein
MPQSQRLSSAIPPVAFERPACPRCKAQMMLVSIEPARARGVDLHTFECAVCNQVLKTLCVRRGCAQGETFNEAGDLFGDLVSFH